MLAHDPFGHLANIHPKSNRSLFYGNFMLRKNCPPGEGLFFNLLNPEACRMAFVRTRGGHGNRRQRAALD
jgi:hypothetical protein